MPTTDGHNTVPIARTESLQTGNSGIQDTVHFLTWIPSSANLQSALWFINDNDITLIYPSSTPGTTHQNGIWWSCF